ncbi:prephenate dehydrogenase/arogenate dehydrogenase family protein [Candidatus Bipolaricaulota bacterium]|nr:prephenate dehydrogenase/arogenate dehydrogenase family protein [Candidatus Bipolaricaulota bacterium]
MDTESEFSRITIVGLGLMGGSVGLAAKNFFPGITVVGVDYEEEIKKALRRGAVDEGYGSDEVTEAVKGSSLVVLATPIEEIVGVLKGLAGGPEEDAVVVDLGSTKREVCATGWSELESSSAEFVGGHPMTGAEIRGIAGAHPLLFENSVFVLVTPEGDATPGSRKLEKFVTGLGAEPRYMKPEKHDAIVARVSHLPQLISICLMGLVGNESDSLDHLSMAGGGFRDMTRIADSPFDIWEDIFETNGELIKEAGKDFLEELKEMIQNLRDEGLKEAFRDAGKLRNELPESSKGISSSTFKLAVMIPDRPNALGELTSILGEKGINIRDLELQKVREDYGGTFQVYFDSLEEARKANKVILNYGFESRVVD